MTTTPVTPRPPVDTTPVATLLTDRGALARTLDDFAAAFTTLSSLLVAAPSAEVLDRVRDAQLLREWPLPGHPDCRRGTALLAESATAGEDESQVRRDYNRLFRGPERMKAPPYESVHRSREHLVFEQETMQVRAAYAEFGLAAPRLGAEPDDHLGLELSFVATLAVRGMDAMEAGDDLELARVLRGLVAFLDEHLLAWAPRCLTQAAGGSTTFFYQGVAALGLGTLALARTTFLP
ncbi:Tat proofreading chaperone TorD [Georgenia soli]|uniref:Tat proofreading chaperone TorD n=1 Tax=Georgenia soli TaxID=638953 RepID=A0A2A9EPF9_9MICO|nr:molecular chaperone TorD family protein [Georgenia soli]PFG40663.1 Tat proofreading chaperone TorD [Georgenia soli]